MNQLRATPNITLYQKQEPKSKSRTSQSAPFLDNNREENGVSSMSNRLSALFTGLPRDDNKNQMQANVGSRFNSISSLTLDVRCI